MVYHSSKFAQRRKRILIWRISLLIIFIVSIIGGTSYWSCHSSVNISNIIIEGNHFIEKEEISNKINELMVGNYFLGYSRSNFLFFPRGEIKEKIKKEYSVLKDLKLKLSGINTLKIELEEYQPQAFWCQKTENRECYLVNSEGVLFLKEPLINDYQFIELYGFIIDSYPIGKQYISADFFQSLLKFTELLSRLEIETKKIETEDNYNFTLITAVSTKIFFDVEDNILDIYDNLQTIIDQDAINKVQFANIDYIDLRFDNRVFYKIR